MSRNLSRPLRGENRVASKTSERKNISNCWLKRSLLMYISCFLSYQKNHHHRDLIELEGRGGGWGGGGGHHMYVCSCIGFEDMK